MNNTKSNAKDIAEKILNCETYDIPDIQSLASAYLELKKRIVLLLRENTLLILDSIEPRTDKDVTIVGLKKEITKLKAENERLNKYVISGYETVHKESLEEITRLIEENEKLSEQVFKDIEYINYIQEQLESAKSVLLQKTLDIDSLTAENKSLKECITILNPTISPVYLQQLSKHIHQTNVEAGWWTNLATGEPLERNVGELLCLVHSEVSEALEAYRKDLMDDKLPHRKGFEVELVDALIRIFDIAGKFKLDLDGALEDKLEYNAKRSDHKLENRQGKNGKKF